MMNKRDYAEAIESHHLYDPKMEGVYSKRYYRYDSEWEVRYLLRNYKKSELAEIYRELYSGDGRELTRHEITAW